MYVHKTKDIKRFIVFYIIAFWSDEIMYVNMNEKEESKRNFL